MPHVVVKLWPGETEADKRALSDAIVRNVTDILGWGDESVSVAIEEVLSGNWSADVYEPEIQGKWETLYKRPGYGHGPNSKD